MPIRSDRKFRDAFMAVSTDTMFWEYPSMTSMTNAKEIKIFFIIVRF